MQPLSRAKARILQTLRDAPHVFCLLDYDGTLAHLAPTPEEALPLAGTADVLRELLTAPHTDVAIVSGRPIAELRSFLDLPGLHYIGIHGIEIEWPSGTRWLAPCIGELWASMPEIRHRVERLIADKAGVWLEDKGATLACHYRLASRADASSARRAMAAVARTYRHKGLSLVLKHGHEVAEIAPASVSKGEAVRRLLDALGHQALAVYAGDDQTDVDAFVALPPGSVTIHVGPTDHAVPARYSVPDPEALQRFLWSLADCRRAAVGVKRAEPCR